jgi:CubicO group peptidase (beta-lactamase class C family)
LISTADDYLKFAQMLHQGGRLAGRRVSSAKTIELMTTNHLTPEQRTHKFLGVDYWAGQGYGFGVEVVDSITRQNRLTSVGEYHMGGAYSTYCQIDPSEDLIIIIMLQLLAAHDFLDVNQFVSTLVYQSLNDV